MVAGKRRSRRSPETRENSAAKASAVRLLEIAQDSKMARSTRSCLVNASVRLKNASARMAFHTAIARLHREPRTGHDPFDVPGLNDAADGWAWVPSGNERRQAIFGLNVLVGITSTELHQTVTVTLGHEDGHREV